MASVERRKDRRTGYVVRWRDEAGAQRKKSFTRKADAERFRAEVEHKLNTGAYVDPAGGKRRFRDYAEQWRTAQPHRPNTASRVETQLRVHAYPVLGVRPVAAVRPSEIQAWVTGLAATHAPGTVRTVFMTTRAVFRSAVRDRLIGLDPTEGIALPTVPRHRIAPLTVAQVDAIANAMPPLYQALVVVAAGTGLRIGELLGLQVRDLDMLRRSLRVERQLLPNSTIGPPKNEASRRTVPLGTVVVDAIAAHLAEYPAKGEQHVFRSSSGDAIARSSFMESYWRPAARAVGLPARTGPHALRHFFASALIAGGLSVKAVSEALGHSNASVTLNVYGHLWPSDEDRSRKAIDAVFAADVPHVRPA